MPSRYAQLTREQLTTIVPELLLIGHLIDRAGMPFCLEVWGEEQMAEIAIEEWAGASPIYTRRMQRALGFVGDDVPTIFKGMQLDIGAPPQFMDFRYSVTDPQHGAFHLDHCGALLDVEPMGASMVKKMCHDIEDPTFDATAVASNPKAEMRPIHRPPREPSDRHPHCAWTVEINPDSPGVEAIPALAVNQRTHAATTVLDDIDPAEDGQGDYSGPLVDDLDFGAFSHSALVRMADEVVLQQHLLNLSFQMAVRERAGDEEAVFHRVASRQLIGHAGVAAERLHRALGLSDTPEDAARVIELHPLMNPLPYVRFERDGASVTVSRSPAHEDGGWLPLCTPETPDALRSIVQGVNPFLDVEVTGTATDWTARVVLTDTAARESGEVAVTKFSKAASFGFEPRKSLPIFVK